MKKPAIKFEYNKNGDLRAAALIGALVLVIRKINREFSTKTKKA